MPLNWTEEYINPKHNKNVRRSRLARSLKMYYEGDAKEKESCEEEQAKMREMLQGGT